MYVIKARMHGCVRNDSETHSTGVTGLHSQLRRLCNPVTQSSVFHCHFRCITPLLTHWSYVSFALTHRYVYSTGTYRVIMIQLENCSAQRMIDRWTNGAEISIFIDFMHYFLIFCCFHFNFVSVVDELCHGVESTEADFNEKFLYGWPCCQCG